MLTEAEHPPAAASWRRSGLLVAAVAAVPLAAGALLYEPTATDAGGPTVVCPFRAAIGLPCPLCGSTRAIALAAHGDLGFVDYNPVAVVVLVAAVVIGLVAALVRGGGGRWARDALARFAAAPGRALLLLAVLAWAWTLTHRATITS